MKNVMDGYLKTKQKELRAEREQILTKYLLFSFAFIFLILCFGGIYLKERYMHHPDRWKETEIVYSYAYVFDMPSTHSTYPEVMIVAEDGREFVAGWLSDLKDLEEYWDRGETYSIVYDTRLLRGLRIKRIEKDGTVYKDMEPYIESWEEECRTMLVFIRNTGLIGILAVIIADRFACKKEYRRIGKIKYDIECRKRKNEKRNAV